VRTPDSDSDHTDYVQCEECGCPVEGHDRNGCRNLGGECACRVPWTAAEIKAARREAGLPARWLAQNAPRI
jgi:hypothetical protein